MARTKKAAIAAKYNAQEAEAKRAYVEKNGYSIAYNWKNQPEKKRIDRNKSKAVTRYEDKKLTVQLEKDVFSFKDPTEITKFDNIVDQGFYFNEIYSPEGDSLIINQFRIAEAQDLTANPKPVRAIIQDEDGTTKIYRTLETFEDAIADLYKELNRRQYEDYKAANKIFKQNPANKDKKLPKSGFIRLVSINSGETDKYEVLTLKIEKP